MEKVLIARENKQNNLKKIMKTGFVYLILKVNVPGEDKRPTVAKFLINLFRMRLNEAFLIENSYFFNDFDGFYEIFEICSHDLLDVKKICIDIEDNSPLGRYVDIDVYYNSLISVSRSDLGHVGRKCYLCDDLAHICARSRKHSSSELIKKMENDVLDYLYKETHQLVIESMKLECELGPKFGLVTKESNGSHSDMNYNLMMKSIGEIAPYITKMTLCGFTDDIDKVFSKIREIGKNAEKSMYLATNGINTYKGLIFGMGFAAAAFGTILKDRDFSYKKLRDIIMYLGRNLREEFNEELNTFGYFAYKKYGFLGARGEVSEGIPNAFKAIEILDYYDDYSDESLTMALVKIIKGLEDTVLLKRSGSIEKYNYFKNLVGTIENYDIDKIEKITNECIKHNISFGGSADILAISIFIKKMKERLVSYE